MLKAAAQQRFFRQCVLLRFLRPQQLFHIFADDVRFQIHQVAPAALVQDYFDLIQAPKKELIWFEQSGHNPMTDEPERFKSLLRDRLQALEKEEPTV